MMVKMTNKQAEGKQVGNNKAANQESAAVELTMEAKSVNGITKTLSKGAACSSVVSWGGESHLINDTYNESVMSNKSHRTLDGVSVSDLLVDKKTFMSFTDPDQIMWGGSYYDMRQVSSENNIAPSLRFRSETPLEDDNQNFLAKEESIKENSKSKFGTWDGVFTSCLLNIFGVIMFLRLP